MFLFDSPTFGTIEGSLMALGVTRVSSGFRKSDPVSTADLMFAAGVETGGSSTGALRIRTARA